MPSKISSLIHRFRKIAQINYTDQPMGPPMMQAGAIGMPGAVPPPMPQTVDPYAMVQGYPPADQFGMTGVPGAMPPPVPPFMDPYSAAQAGTLPQDQYGIIGMPGAIPPGMGTAPTEDIMYQYGGPPAMAPTAASISDIASQQGVSAADVLADRFRQM
ncbi:MAG: hypothetical protein ABIM30_00450 [candidate division WOR-3 bacterium]